MAPPLPVPSASWSNVLVQKTLDGSFGARFHPASDASKCGFESKFCAMASSLSKGTNIAIPVKKVQRCQSRIVVSPRRLIAMRQFSSLVVFLADILRTKCGQKKRRRAAGDAGVETSMEFNDERNAPPRGNARA